MPTHTDTPDALDSSDDRTTVSGTDSFLDTIFDDDGNAFNRYWDWEDLSDEDAWDKHGEPRRTPLAHDDTTDTGSLTLDDLPDPDDNPEAFLERVAEDKLAELTDRFDDLPTLRETHIAYHARTVARSTDADTLLERARDTNTTDSSPGLVITHHQQHRVDIWNGVDTDSTDEWETILDTCPQCGAENVGAATVEAQLRASDEGGTQETKTECGCTIRNYS